MALAYFLLGLVAMYGVYWTVKYIMLPRQDGGTASDKPQTKLHTAKPSTPTKSRTSRTTTSPTSRTTTSPTTKGSQFCRKSGYEHHKKSGYCYRFSTSPLTWPKAKAACENEDATLTVAHVRVDANASLAFVEDLFRKHKASEITGDNKNYVAVGLYLKLRHPKYSTSDKMLVSVTAPDSYEYSRVQQIILYADHPKLTDVNYTPDKNREDQDWVFMNRQGQLYYFLDNFKGPFICEYNANIDIM